MLEIPEAIVIAGQLNGTVKGKRIERVIAAASAHKFAWYYGDPAEYDALLRGRVLGEAFAYGGRVEIEAGDAAIHIGDGAILRYYKPDDKLPVKHQLLAELDGGGALVVTVAMYGGIWAFPAGGMDDNFYYMAAKEAVPPLSERFDLEYFLSLFEGKPDKMSAKAFLATEQRIPGLGNGVLQDILLNVRIHPKTKIGALDGGRRREMFDSVKSTLAEMVAGGGRDTERDLFGSPGGYRTKLSKNNSLSVCPNCGGTVRKENYLGGSIYFCERCQEV